MKEEERRCFLALPLADHFLKEAREFHILGGRRLPDVKWVAPENIHVTLHFFGNVTESEIAVIERIAREAALSESPMAFSMGGIGFFPSPEKIKVIWAGLQGDLERLRNFQAGLEKALIREGFPTEDRPFNPHVTLGRTRGPGLRFPGDLNFPQTELKKIEAVVLYESKTLERAKTPVYTPFLSFPFTAKA